MKKRYPTILQDSRRRGAALPLVVCAAAFLIAFSLAIVYTSGLLMAGADKKIDQERCFQLAASFAGELDKELKKPDSEFRVFADQFLNSDRYNEYDPDNPATVYHYIANDNAGSSYGVIKLRLSKEINDSEKGTLQGYLPEVNASGNFTDIVEERQNQIFQRYVFRVEVIAQLDDMSYNYDTEYLRTDKYPVKFSHGGNMIVWDETANCWKIGTTSGEIYNGWQGSDERIRYEYDTGNLMAGSGEYTNVYEEAAPAGGTGTGG